MYELTVPTSEPSNLATGLDVLREWLSAATLEPGPGRQGEGRRARRVAPTRPVVRGPGRQRDRGDVSCTGTEYDGRQPIGTDEAIKAMTPDLLRRFYDTWYRPDNAAIMVVGDIDVDAGRSRDPRQLRGVDAPAVTRRRARIRRWSHTVRPDASVVMVDPDATTG